jgi:dihydrolipoamide dehydrogenase
MDYDLIIIGSGPAGYVAAIRAGQVGLKTAIVEKSEIGGMCLNWGCIPTKVLLESAKKLAAVKSAADFGIDGIDQEAITFNWKTVLKRSERIVGRLKKGVEYLLKKNGIEMIKGEAEIITGNSISVKNRLLETKNIIVATGSMPQKPGPGIPGDKIIEISDLLNAAELPRKPFVLGNGPHAVELAQFFGIIGKEVKLLVPEDRLLPGIDPSLEEYVKRIFKKSKIDFVFFKELAKTAQGELLIDGEEAACDKIINALKRNAILPPAGIEFSLNNGFLKVDQDLRTNFPNIYAVGDVNGLSYLAHAASAQGLFAVNRISGIKEELNIENIPWNMYTFPEIAQVGLTEPAIKEKGIDYKLSEFPLSANGKALAEGHTDGVVRVLSEKKYGEVLGVQIVAQHATDMIAEAAAVLQLEGTVFDIAKTVHAHPTISEIFMEAGFAAFDQPIHK